MNGSGPPRSDGKGALILLRHGESTTNADGVFTGLLDVALTASGERQATRAGLGLESNGLYPDVVYSSTLRRAVRTAELVLEAFMPSTRPEIRLCGALTERHYGALTGQSKIDVAHQYGWTSYDRWRNSFETAPPPITDLDFRRLRRENWPLDKVESSSVESESLRDVTMRIGHILRQRLVPRVQDGEVVLVVAHGNSLRAITAELCGLTAEELARLRIAPGAGLVYNLSPNGPLLDRKLG